MICRVIKLLLFFLPFCFNWWTQDCIGRLISLGLHNFTLKLKVNSFICLFLTSYFFRKLHYFLSHTDTLGTVLSTMTSCLKSLLKIYWSKCSSVLEKARSNAVELFLPKPHIVSAAGVSWLLVSSQSKGSLLFLISLFNQKSFLYRI